MNNESIYYFNFLSAHNRSTSILLLLPEVGPVLMKFHDEVVLLDKHTEVIKLTPEKLKLIVL